MKTKRSTRSALFTSVVSLLLCVSMLVGSTFAWFTDTATTGVNQIVSGNLDVVLEMWDGTAWVNAEGRSLNFIAKDGNQNILWEPGCTYNLPQIRVRNDGDLHLKYTIAITGINGDAKLNEAIEWTANGADMAALAAETPLAPGADSGAITISGHMKEEAGNEYQDLTIDGISITVYATQYTSESDSFGDQYDSGAQFPDQVVTAAAKVAITTENGLVTVPATYTNDSGVAVTIPAGVKVNAGVTELGISITKKAASDSNITIKENEIINAYDVHVEGIAADNTVPVIVEMQGIMPKNLNTSAFAISHVESTGTVAMTYVPSNVELTAHNQYHYDPATGDLTVAMATFSEVTLLVNSTNPWDGTADKTWYNTTDTEFTIYNAQQLAGFAQLLSTEKESSLWEATIKLAADIDLSGNVFYPIGAWFVDENGTNYSDFGDWFGGVFDGQGHTIKGLKQTWGNGDDYRNAVQSNGANSRSLGLFGYLWGATIKNLTLDSFYLAYETTNTGILAGYYGGGGTFENISVVNCEAHANNYACGGLVGYEEQPSGDESGYKYTFKNVTVDSSNIIGSQWGVYDTCAGGIVGLLAGSSSAEFENCNVSCVLDVYNDVCANYQYYWYRYCGMYIGTVDKKTTDDTGREMPDLSNITATNCTVSIGDWSNYYYCEFENAGKPSYAAEGQYKFRRCTEEELVRDEDGNVTGCTHTHSTVEDNRAVLLEFNQLFNGYGWGVDAVDMDEWNATHENQINITDITNAEEKFDVKFENTDKYLYRIGNGNAVALSSLFAAITGKTINQSGVYVSITKLDADTDVAGTYTANTTDWTQGTLKFTGTGPVKITIQDYDFCKPTELLLEIVDGKNVTTATNVSNSNVVLLNDIRTAGLTIQNGYTLFGNGFAINDTRTAEQTTYNNGWIQIFGSYIDNAQIMGQDYPTAVTSGVSNQYYSPTVRINGGGGIYNSLVNGGRYAVLTSGGEIELVNTTLAGGAIANMNISGMGTLLLDNVTTVQVSGTTNPPYGMAIAVESQDVQITIKNDLKQYNWAKQTDIPSSYNNIFSDLYTSSNYSNIRYTNGGNTYVNTGIFFFSDSASFDGSNLVNANGGDSFVINGKTYTKVTKTVFGNTGVCYTLNSASASTDMLGAPEYISAGQYSIAPEFDFSITDDNTEKRHYAYYDTDTGSLKVGFEEESTAGYVWTSAPTASKNGSNLTVTVTMNGVDYTNKSITFNKAGDYSIVYTYTDNSNYDKNGNKYSVTYEKVLPVKVVAIAQDAKNADFTFYAPDGTSYSAKVVVIDGKNYVMPDVSATETGKVMSTTINGTTVYAPYVECQYNDNTSDFNYVYPLLTGVNITDYEDGKPGGTTTTYNKSTTNTALFGTPGTKFNVITALETWNYGISNDLMSFKTKSGDGLCLWSGKKGSDIAAMYIIGEFSYTDNAGTTYYYCVYYNMAAHTCPSCVTPETLITLADGSQVMAKDLTGSELLLAWNHETGKFEATPIAYIVNHDDKETEHVVTALTFANGKTVEIIGEHIFFDNTLGRYVTLTAENAESFIGHAFSVLSGDTLSTSTLVSAVSETRMTQAYEVVTYKKLNCVTEGVLSCSGYVEALLNMFEIESDTMRYDMAQVQADVEQYGLYTYADFAHLIPENVFEMYNAQYLKIAVGKGQITWEGIEALIDFYYSLDITPLQ